MLNETVKRWTIIVLLIVIALLAVVVMAMRVDVRAAQSKADALTLQNQQLMTVAADNAKQVKQLIADNQANDVLSDHRQQGKATAREQTRSNAHVVHQSLSSESCSTVQLPVGALSVLRRAGSDTHADAVSVTSKSSDP